MKTYLVGIGGPSGAGKSTFCRKIERSHCNVGRLKLDDFFCDLGDVEMIDGHPNWDHPKCIDWAGLRVAAYTLKQGKSATTPHYDRSIDRCIGTKCILPKSIIIVDGFMTLYDQELRDLLDMTFFLHLDEDEQIARRKKRQPWVKEGYLQNIMLPAARQYVIPSSKHADEILDAKHDDEVLYQMILDKIHKQNPVIKKCICD